DLLAGLVVGTHPGDSDKDGMADVWERANGLDTSDGTDHSTVMESGYTAIEEYCNMLAQRLIETRGRPPEKIYDFNSDGELNIADAIALILLAKENQDELRFDTNGDGVWTIIDVVKLIIIILGS
ncbi:MAG: hypothetical protein U9N45_08640, partial [Gemmatimonadota bacterium]|nr:hypothetical protein [Gemmatimonadota bacterium]